MAGKASPIPEGFHSVTPHLIIKGAGAAMDFYKRAFGAEEIMCMKGPDGGVMLMVEDNGIGIAPEHLERVMEPFAQVEADLDRRFEGIGMGLPLSRGLARLHGGDLALESQVGKGTRAIVTLPPERSIEGGHLQAVK